MVTDRVGTAVGWTKITAVTQSSSYASATSRAASGYGTALGQVRRQRRLAGDRHPGPQPAALDRCNRAGRSRELVVAKTLRRTLLALPGRLTRSARRWTLHLPAGWPWAAWFELAPARLRCVAYAT